MGAAVAQNRPTFIINGGYQGSNLSNLKDNKMKNGFRVGVAMDMAFMNSDVVSLSVMPGVNYVTKGFSLESENSKGKAEDNAFTLNYIEVPVLLNARFGVNDAFSAFVNAGPYFAYGIGGKYKATLFGISKDEEINTFKKHDFGVKEYSFANAFDMGLQIGAGVEMSRVLLTVGAQYGITNVFGDDSKESMKKNLKDSEKGSRNVGFYATVGYRF